MRKNGKLRKKPENPKNVKKAPVNSHFQTGKIRNHILLKHLTCQKEIPSRSAEKHFFREGIIIFLKKSFNDLTALKKCLKSV